MFQTGRPRRSRREGSLMNNLTILAQGYRPGPELEAAVREVFPALEDYFTPEQRRAFRDTPYPYLILYNYLPGEWIRTSLLKPGSALCAAFRAEGFWDRKEMSLVILLSWHQSLRETDPPR